LRETLINDKLSAYNIQTTDNKITIQKKSVINIIEIGIMIKQYREFCLFLDGLIGAGVI